MPKRPSSSLWRSQREKRPPRLQLPVQTQILPPQRLPLSLLLLLALYLLLLPMLLTGHHLLLLPLLFLLILLLLLLLLLVLLSWSPSTGSNHRNLLLARQAGRVDLLLPTAGTARHQGMEVDSSETGVDGASLSLSMKVKNQIECGSPPPEGQKARLNFETL